MKFVIILLPLLLHFCDEILLSKAVVLPNFYPFGQSEGDQPLPRNDDRSSGTVPISIQFPFFDQNHNSLFVNTNGVISFLVEVSQFTPDAFPLGDNRRLVAPFWADVNTNNGGDVFYRETTDPNLLQQATNDVTVTFVDQRKFKATWLLIATWYDVAFHGARGNYTNKRNTFQVVLISNGRHSFVIFNYNKITWTTGTASSGNETGLGGTPAQAGFNAGDGRRFFSIPGSRTHQVINLPTQSNVGNPGRWMFRIDSAKIEAGGCNTKGSLVISPRTGIMLGGDNFFIAGPCYKPGDVIVCEFAGGKRSNGSYISNIRASCTVPMLYVTGRLALKMSVNGGTSFDFQGAITIVNIRRFTPRVARLLGNRWREQNPLQITWDPGQLGSESQTVAVHLARFSMRTSTVVFDSMFTLVAEQANTGEANFTVPKGEGQGAAVGDGRFITLVMVKKTGNSSGVSPAEWIWSDLVSWISYAFGNERCKHWYRNQPHPKIYLDDPSFLPCPQTIVQAMADRGRFTIDEYCNPDAEEHCVLYHYGVTHCFRTNTPSNKGAGQQCCYTGQGNLMVGTVPFRGSLDRFHIEAGVPVLSHFFHDLVPYLDCCVFSDNCGKYFEKRPSDDGSNYEPPRPAAGIGDPHMITLDGVEYTFNGYGEYQILQVAGPDFQLQGRMQPLINDDGNKSRATVYKAFAMKENGSDAVQFRISGRNEIEVLVNGNLMEFDEQLMMDFNGAIILKYNNSSKYSSIFDSGISVTVEEAEGILQMMLLVPPVFKGNTSGLLGFWDGNQDKEFLLPNGEFLETNSSHSRIHYEFGQLWATSADGSLFIYEEGMNHSSYFDAGYVPIFLDKGDLAFDDVALGKQARDACGDNKQCLFDIFTTGKVSIGIASKQAVESFIAVINETETAGCVPIKNSLQNGSMQRNSSEDGGMVYKFYCDKGFRLNGSAVIHCYQGQWNGSKPNCEAKVTEAEISSSTRLPWYIFGAVSAAATFALLAATTVLIRFLQNRRKDRQQIHEEQQATSQTGNEIKQDLSSVPSFTNPAYTSSTNDLRSKGSRHEMWRIKAAWT